MQYPPADKYVFILDMPLTHKSWESIISETLIGYEYTTCRVPLQDFHKMRKSARVTQNLYPVIDSLSKHYGNGILGYEVWFLVHDTHPNSKAVFAYAVQNIVYYGY